MFNYNYATLESLSIHQVGNKGKEEGFHLSKNCVETHDDLKEILIHYFFSSFKENGYYQFSHETDLELNEVYSYVTEIFNQPDKFHKQSIKLAKYLYGQSLHPNIKPGEFYVAYFKDCHINGTDTEAIGLFKSESKDQYLKVYSRPESFDIESDTGFNINKLDKGCIIFNLEKEDGFVVSIVDRTNKETEAHFWVDQFLQLHHRNDNYFKTEQAINLCKTFVQKQLAEEFDLSKAEQADLLNKSARFFNENESFELVEFAHDVMEEPKLVKSFSEYKSKYEEQEDIRISDEFDISMPALKKKKRVFKSVIKLDKNFHIYVHGNRNYILKGYDEESGMSYYQLFFNEEK